jgi:bacterioferritin
MEQKNDLLKALNSLLIEKLTVVNKFMVHSEMCENLGYSNLHLAIQNMAMDQMQLAEWLIERISFLDNSSALSSLKGIMIKKTVADLVNKNKNEHPVTIHAYNEAIHLAYEADDNATAALLTRILKKEENHLGWTELQRKEIEQKGLEEYLATQIEYQAN